MTGHGPHHASCTRPGCSARSPRNRSDPDLLLVGLVHAGQLPVAALPGIHAGLAPAYAEGMRAGRHPAPVTDVYRGYVGSLAIRAAFTALPLHQLDTASQEMTDQRAALTRFILDTSHELGW